MAEAIVLAGGFSKRFGDRDKSVACLDGSPLVSHVVGSLADADEIEAVVLNTRAEQTPELRTAVSPVVEKTDVRLKFAEDEVPGLGPVGGIAEGLEKVNSEYAGVVACDMPLVDPNLIEFLLRVAREGKTDAAVPRVDGWLQTTQAVYGVEPMSDVCETLLNGVDGERDSDADSDTDTYTDTDDTEELDDSRTSLRDCLKLLEYTAVEKEEVLRHASEESFINVNKREDLECVEELV